MMQWHRLFVSDYCHSTTLDWMQMDGWWWLLTSYCSLAARLLAGRVWSPQCNLFMLLFLPKIVSMSSSPCSVSVGDALWFRDERQEIKQSRQWRQTGCLRRPSGVNWLFFTLKKNKPWSITGAEPAAVRAAAGQHNKKLSRRLECVLKDDFTNGWYKHQY